MDRSRREIPRRTVLEWLLGVTGFTGILAACGKTPETQKPAPRTTPTKKTYPLSVQRGMQWIHANTTSAASELRIWSGMAEHFTGNNPAAAAEMDKAFKGHRKSRNARATLEAVSIMGRQIPSNMTPVIGQNLINVPNSDNRGIIDDHLLRILKGEADDLLSEMVHNGLAEVEGGPASLSVECMIAMFTLHFYGTSLSRGRATKVQEWLVAKLKQAPVTMLFEKTMALLVLSYNQKGETRSTQVQQTAKKLKVELESVQHEDGSFTEPQSMSSRDAKFLATTTCTMALAKAS